MGLTIAVRTSVSDRPGARSNRLKIHLLLIREIGALGLITAFQHRATSHDFEDLPIHLDILCLKDRPSVLSDLFETTSSEREDGGTGTR